MVGGGVSLEPCAPRTPLPPTSPLREVGQAGRCAVGGEGSTAKATNIGGQRSFQQAQQTQCAPVRVHACLWCGVVDTCMCVLKCVC